MVKKIAYKIIWDDQAIDQLTDYLERVSKQSQSAPRLIRDRILDRLKAVQKNPYICEPDRFRDHNDGSYIAFTVYTYRVTYNIKDKYIRVIRVRSTNKEPFEY